MRKLKLHHSTPPDIPEASTADIAFLLLIFFIVSTGFPDIGLPLILPSSTGVVKEVARSNVLEVVTARTGEYYIGKTETPVSLETVAQTVRDQLVANDKLIILLETHPDAPYEKFVDALDEVMVTYERLDQQNIRRERRISIKTIEYE
jgi:biopolymer transport protein ExbD